MSKKAKVKIEYIFEECSDAEERLLQAFLMLFDKPNHES